MRVLASIAILGFFILGSSGSVHAEIQDSEGSGKMFSAKGILNDSSPDVFATGKELKKGLRDQKPIDFFEESEFRRTVERLEKSVNTELKVGQGPSQHKFEFNLKTFESRAKLQYTGLVDAKATYKADINDLRVSVTQSLSEISRIMFERTNKEDLSQLSIVWDW